LNATFPSPTTTGVSPWSEAGILCRRICLLRLRGQREEAASLEATELARTVEAIRRSPGIATDCDQKLEALFAREEERVATASVVAEILLPLLDDSRPAAKDVRPVRSSRAERTLPRVASATPLGIADFIDEMIQQERAASHAATS